MLNMFAGSIACTTLHTRIMVSLILGIGDIPFFFCFFFSAASGPVGSGPVGSDFCLHVHWGLANVVVSCGPTIPDTGHRPQLGRPELTHVCPGFSFCIEQQIIVRIGKGPNSPQLTPTIAPDRGHGPQLTRTHPKSPGTPSPGV